MILILRKLLNFNHRGTETQREAIRRNGERKRKGEK